MEVPSSLRTSKGQGGYVQILKIPFLSILLLISQLDEVFSSVNQYLFSACEDLESSALNFPLAYTNVYHQ